MRLNYWMVYCGGNIMETPSTLSGVEAPAAATIVLSSSEVTFTLAEIPSDVTNLKLIIQASEPQSNGITRAYSKAAAFADPYTPCRYGNRHQERLRQQVWRSQRRQPEGLLQVLLHQHRHR